MPKNTPPFALCERRPSIPGPDGSTRRPSLSDDDSADVPDDVTCDDVTGGDTDDVSGRLRSSATEPDGMLKLRPRSTVLTSIGRNDKREKRSTSLDGHSQRPPDCEETTAITVANTARTTDHCGHCVDRREGHSEHVTNSTDGTDRLQMGGEHRTAERRQKGSRGPTMR